MKRILTCLALLTTVLGGPVIAETARLGLGRVIVTPEALEGCDPPTIKEISRGLPGLKKTVNRKFVCKLPVDGRTLDIEIGLWVFQGTPVGGGRPGKMEADQMYEMLSKSPAPAAVRSPMETRSLQTRTTTADFFCWTLTGDGGGGRTRTLLTCMIDAPNAPVTILVHADDPAEAYRVLAMVGAASSIE